MAGELKSVFEKKVLGWSACDAIDNVLATRSRCRDVTQVLVERRDALGKGLNAITAATDPKPAL
jgi:hypothetical protein